MSRLIRPTSCLFAVPLAPPISVTSIDKAFSDTAGGKTRRVVGTSIPNTIVASDVLFGATAATAVTWIDASNIDVVVPAHAAGTVDLHVLTATLANAMTFWNLTVPATPTAQFRRGNYTSGSWAHSTDSLAVNATTFSAAPAVGAESEPVFTPSEALVLGGSKTWPDLIDSDTTNDATIAFVIDISAVTTAFSAGAPYTGEGIVEDSNFRGQLMVTRAPLQLSWYWYDGTFRHVDVPIGLVYAFANNYTFVSSGGVGDTVTRDAGSWIDDGCAIGKTVVFSKPGEVNDTKTGVVTAVSALTLTLTSNIVNQSATAGFKVTSPGSGKIAGLLQRSLISGTHYWRFSLDGGATWTAANAQAATTGQGAGSSGAYLGYSAAGAYASLRNRAIAFYKMGFSSQDAINFNGWASAEYT